ncbi:hypothetical protein [Halorussus lipolyticus]|uniref:hypothetical protein n=1 Tax=Halorussus lipolyticus TaxID=3034024 RepID=UPI0023E86EFE|nr:hypothetical protein [Halorussus sp. DT80]
MADTKDGREKKAKNQERRQQEREIAEARNRADEAEPPGEEADETQRQNEGSDAPRACHRRGCDEPAAFSVLERYQEETGHGAVEAEAFLCRDHTAEESPANLDAAYEDYVFRVEQIRTTSETDTS